VDGPRSSLLLVALASLAACGDSTDPSTAVLGDYEATRFTVTPTGSSPSGVRLEASMVLGLYPDGEAHGNVFIPGSVTEDGQDFEIIIDGTYTVSGDEVQLRHKLDEDSFLETMRWVIGPNTLTATLDDTDRRIEITLTRLDPPVGNAVRKEQV
jgi:hypothetical protein